jgi:hypothetical protein
MLADDELGPRGRPAAKALISGRDTVLGTHNQ